MTGKLSEREAAAFESHYLTCVRCQEELRLAAAIREELGEGEKGGDRTPPKSSESDGLRARSENGENPGAA